MAKRRECFSRDRKPVTDKKGKASTRRDDLEGVTYTQPELVRPDGEEWHKSTSIAPRMDVDNHVMLVNGQQTENARRAMLAHAKAKLTKRAKAQMEKKYGVENVTAAETGMCNTAAAIGFGHAEAAKDDARAAGLHFGQALYGAPNAATEVVRALFQYFPHDRPMSAFIDAVDDGWTAKAKEREEAGEAPAPIDFNELMRAVNEYCTYSLRNGKGKRTRAFWGITCTHARCHRHWDEPLEYLHEAQRDDVPMSAYRRRRVKETYARVTGPKRSTLLRGWAEWLHHLEQSESVLQECIRNGILPGDGSEDAQEQVREAFEQLLIDREVDTRFIPKKFRKRQLPQDPSEYCSAMPRDGNERRYEWGEMSLKRVPLVRSLPTSLTGLEGRAMDEGTLPRNMHRWCSDGRIFKHIKRSTQGSVLIDVSGSMHINQDQLEELFKLIPHGIVGIYAGADDGTGELAVIARDGRFGVSDHWRREVSRGLNVIDGPALKWLGRQMAPRVWVSDGYVTGVSYDESGRRVAAGEATHLSLRLSAHAICQRHSITRIPSVPAAIHHFSKGR